MAKRKLRLKKAPADGDKAFLDLLMGGDAPTAPGGADDPSPWARTETWAAAGAVLSGAAAAALWKMPGDFGAVASFVLVAGAATAGVVWAGVRRRERDGVPHLLQAAIDTAPDAHFITQRDGRIIYANKAFRRLFRDLSAPAEESGFAWAKAVSDDSDWGAVHSLQALVGDGDAHGLDAQGEFTRLVQSAANGVPDHTEIPLKTESGSLQWRRISVMPLRMPGGGLWGGGDVRALWRAEDITSRREFQASCRREAEVMSDLLGNLPAGFFSADAGGHVLFMNAMLASWLGVDAERAASGDQRFADYVASVDPIAVATEEDDAPSIASVSLRRRDGSTFRAMLVQSEQSAPGGEAIYSRSLVLRDLGPRASGDSAPLLERLHWLFDAAPVGIVVTDMGGEVMDCNDAFLRLSGLARGALNGHPIADVMASEDRDEVAAQLSKLVMGAVPSASLDVRLPAGEGQGEVTCTLYATRMVDDSGDVRGIVLHFIDTTEQKHLEMQFAQSQKMQAVGQLAGGVAHDFNNLLTAMIGFCDLLLGRHGPDDPSFADIMQIKQNANRATNLVRQLLAFSRREAHQPVAVTVADALSDLSNLLGRLLGENVTLVMEPGRGREQVFVDRGQFDQIIINLAVNARDAMPKGGTLTIRADGLTLDEPQMRGAVMVPVGEYVTIDISDTGQGMSRDVMERIFEPFFSTKEVGQGTGLGLSTVYGIVEQAGGLVTVDSAPGEGAVFSIILPRYSGAAAVDGTPIAEETVVEAPPQDTDLTGAGTVLIVEDEDAVRMFGARALTNKGYTVIEAANGEEAIEAINTAETPVDLIVSDVVMPGMDGHTLVKLVREDFPNVKVILMSGYAEDVFREEIDRDLDVAFLPKPFTLKDLAAKVKDVLES